MLIIGHPGREGLPVRRSVKTRWESVCWEGRLRPPCVEPRPTTAGNDVPAGPPSHTTCQNPDTGRPASRWLLLLAVLALNVPAQHALGAPEEGEQIAANGQLQSVTIPVSWLVLASALVVLSIVVLWAVFRAVQIRRQRALKKALDEYRAVRCQHDRLVIDADGVRAERDQLSQELERVLSRCTELEHETTEKGKLLQLINDRLPSSSECSSPPLVTLSGPGSEKTSPLDNKAWLGLVEECVDLFDELDRYAPSMDGAGRELAQHIMARIQEVLARCGVSVIEGDNAFTRSDHQSETGGGAVEGSRIVHTLSPGFRVDQRVLRRAIVAIEAEGEGLS